MIEKRLHVDPSQTQRITTGLLSTHGLISLVLAPVIAHYADNTPNRKIPFLAALAGSLLGVLCVASTATGMISCESN
jgi:MFS-type transporter involved in bile tolerance (Atg22 family)